MSHYGFGSRAAKRTVCAANATTTVESGQTITVYGIVLSNTSTQATVTVNNGSGTTLFTLSAAAGTTPIEIEWLADAGLQFSTPANVSVIVFHSHGGS